MMFDASAYHAPQGFGYQGLQGQIPYTPFANPTAQWGPSFASGMLAPQLGSVPPSLLGTPQGQSWYGQPFGAGIAQQLACLAAHGQTGMLPYGQGQFGQGLGGSPLFGQGLPIGQLGQIGQPFGQQLGHQFGQPYGQLGQFGQPFGQLGHQFGQAWQPFGQIGQPFGQQLGQLSGQLGQPFGQLAQMGGQLGQYGSPAVGGWPGLGALQGQYGQPFGQIGAWPGQLPLGLQLAALAGRGYLPYQAMAQALPQMAYTG